MRLARVKCPHCGAHDQIPLPLNFVSGWAGYYYCSSCKQPGLFFQIGRTLSSYKLNASDMSPLTEKGVAWYILEVLVKLHKNVLDCPEVSQAQEEAINGYDDEELLAENSEQEECGEEHEYEEEEGEEEVDACLFCVCDHCGTEVRVPWFDGFILEPPYSLEPTGLVTSCPTCTKAMLMIFPGEDSEYTDKQHMMLDDHELKSLDVLDFFEHIRGIVRGKISVPLGVDIRVHVIDLAPPNAISQEDIEGFESELKLFDESQFWRDQEG